MIGTDIIEIERVAKSIESKRFMERIFTEKEISYYESKGKRTQTLAGIFAAKEAISKACGVGLSGYNPTDIEITHDERGCPLASAYNKAAQLLENYKIHISISHNNTTAIAVAMLEKK